MDSTVKDRGQGLACGSLLNAIPSPDEILDRMNDNSAENRILRSLYRVARKIESHNQEAAENRQGVTHDA